MSLKIDRRVSMKQYDIDNILLLLYIPLSANLDLVICNHSGITTFFINGDYIFVPLVFFQTMNNYLFVRLQL